VVVALISGALIYSISQEAGTSDLTEGVKVGSLTDEVLVLEQVFKNYGKVNALSGLNLRVREGEILGLVGPDGAGKTTTLRIMSTLLKPDSGVVQVCGIDAQTEGNKVKRSIGYVPDLPLLYDNLTAFDGSSTVSILG